MKIKNNKKGFTIIESVIAMLLVSVVVGGVFATLMAARRAIIEPTYKEDIAYSVESVKNMLKTNLSGYAIADGLGNRPCGSGSAPLASSSTGQSLTGTGCSLIPDVCNSTSSYTYQITDDTVADPLYTGTGRRAFTTKRLYIYMNCKRDAL